MFLLLPLIGGFLAGWLAPRRAAVATAIVLFVVGAAVFVASGPRHDTSAGESLVLCVPAALVCAGTTYLGTWLRRRRTPRVNA